MFCFCAWSAQHFCLDCSQVYRCVNERLTIIEKNSTLKDNSPIIRITIDLIRLECHEQLYSGVITRMSSCFSISRRLVVKLFTWRSDLKGFDHNLKNATVKEYLCGMREVCNENKPMVLAENSNETDLSFKSAVMKKENPSITMYLGVDNRLDICKNIGFYATTVCIG